MIHDLKCWPEYFQAVKFGIKPFELRKDDRGFAVGDILHLREYDPDTELYTGDEIDKTVTYVLPTKLFGAIGEGAKYVIMGLAPRDWTPCAEGLPKADTKDARGNDRVYLCTIQTPLRNCDIIREYCYGTHIGFDGKDCVGWFFAAEYHGSIYSDISVVAWMPKPAPYRADDTTGKVKEDEECKE